MSQKTDTPDTLKNDLEVLKRGPDHPDFQKGYPHIEIIKSRTDRKGIEYVSKLSGRSVRGITTALEMLVEELDFLVSNGETLQGLRRHYDMLEGRRPNKATLHLPRVSTLEDALKMPLEEPFVFDKDDVPTPTGRFFKPFQTCVVVECGDGSLRVIHSSDRHQLVDESGVVRSHEQVIADRRRAARERAKAARKRASVDV